MPDPEPKKKLVAMIKPPPNIAEMTKEELDAYAEELWATQIKPALDRSRDAPSEPPKDA